jgi:hypothetical protein
MIEIGDGAGDAQDAIVRTGRKVHAANCHFECALAAVIECAEASQLRGRDLRVVETALTLSFTGLFHSFAYVHRRMAVALAAELFIGYGRNLDVQVDAIEQRSADLGEIALDDARRAAAFARDITVKTARTPV